MDEPDIGWLEDHGTWCPTQVSGTSPDGKHVYARYRFGQLTVHVDGELMFSCTVGDSMNGVADASKMKEIAYYVWATYKAIEEMN